MTTQQPWNRRLSALGPMFQPLEEMFGTLLPDVFPDTDALCALVGTGVHTRGGQAVSFIPPTGDRQSALSYECAVFETGFVETRPGSWHDLFNALTWALFPQAKAQLNSGHYDERDQPSRSPRRDALTLVDEAGLLVAVTEECFEAFNRDHAWARLFVQHREDWHQEIMPMLFGHGLMAQCMAPYVGLTAKAIYLPVPEDFRNQPLPQRISVLDRLLAHRLVATQSPRELLPLPVLGIPGWCALNEDRSFYRNEKYFRPPRS